LCAESIEKRNRSDLGSGRSGHLPALLRASLARSRALLTVLHLVLGALLPALFTDFRAGRANSSGRLARPAHYRRGQCADFGAVNVHRDAARHHLDVVFLQARGGAMIASFCTVIASFDAACKSLMRHVVSPLSKLTSPFTPISGRVVNPL
jgi:hypothetical protein